MIRTKAIALTLALCAPAAMAARPVTSLPLQENFDTDAYTRDLVELTRGARHEWQPSGGWRGGAAVFYPPTETEGYSGLGDFVQIDQHNGRVTQLNVRFLAWHGRTLGSLGPKNSKLVIMNPNQGTRPMILKNGRFYPEGDQFGYYGACLSTVCTMHDGWPTPGTGFQYGEPDRPENFNGEWVSVELQANTVDQTVKLFIHTQDGRVSGLQAQRSDFNDADFFTRIDGVPGYWGNREDGWPRQYDDETYIKIDELVISDRYIGPPPGFVGGNPGNGGGNSGDGDASRPAAPRNLR